MGNIFNTDFQEFIQAFNNAHVDYMLVGGYSVIMHGHNRINGDMDIWVIQTQSNYAKIEQAFGIFKMRMFDMTIENFLDHKNDVFTFGRSPVAIDIITNLKGLEFELAFKNSTIVTIDDFDIRLIHLNDLIQAKKAAGRPRDIDDIEHLTHD